MIETSTPIVVVAYNRPDCLQRILDALGKADYDKLGAITLIISIDHHSENRTVLEVAQDFNWSFGEKIIKYQNSNLGLRKHILQCGNYATVYGSVIILEDDLFVAPTFYRYAIEALKFSQKEEYIGGISLYNHQINGQTLTNFSPIEDGYDNWYFQFPASWGQGWTKAQWEDFMQWYETDMTLDAMPSIPRNVTYWSENSWLKFFVAYLIEKDKYFLYPKIGLSSNFSEAGQHNFEGSTAFQVTLRYRVQQKFNFSTLDQSESVYDAFYENEKLYKYLQIKKEDCCVNLFEFKPLPTPQKYLLTTAKLSYKIIKSFGLSLKPIDFNVIFNISGNDIYLYDVTQKEKNKFYSNRYRRLIYNYKILTLKDSIYLAYMVTVKRAHNIFLKVIGKR